MKRSLHIEEELNELSKSLADLPFVNTYTIPNDYFTQLHQEILLKINKSNSYHVPDGYFDQLSAGILNKIKQEAPQQNSTEEELLTIAPTLAGLSRKNVYAVPEGYFNRLQINNKETAKVVAIGASAKKKFIWIRYAAAACMIGVISLLAFNFFSRKEVAKEDRVIAGTNVTYKEIKNLNVDQELEKVSGTEMDSYLCNNGLIACNDDKDDNLVNDLEKLNITDEELDALLEETKN